VQAQVRNFINTWGPFLAEHDINENSQIRFEDVQVYVNELADVHLSVEDLRVAVNTTLQEESRDFIEYDGFVDVLLSLSAGEAHW